ncbi:MAG: hypothetical protein EAX91_09015 [Candidatus Lokiarchaeota archaeon]|nr:hypothetical protein [Candidatus Lokiarchaeota archaeon]
MDCIANILEFYNKKSKEGEIDLSKFSRVYLSNLLIKIMNNFNSERINDLELRNCLILLVNLFSNNDSPDHYNHKGRSTHDLINNEKAEYKEILKAEFLGN